MLRVDTESILRRAVTTGGLRAEAAVLPDRPARTTLRQVTGGRRSLRFRDPTWPDAGRLAWLALRVVLFVAVPSAFLFGASYMVGPLKLEAGHGWAVDFFIEHWQAWILLGTLGAIAFVALIGYLMQRLLHLRPSLWWMSVVLGIVVVVGVPAGRAVYEFELSSEPPPEAKPIPRHVDILIVNPPVPRGALDQLGPRKPTIPPPPEDFGRWNGTFSTATILQERPNLSFSRGHLQVRSRHQSREEALAAMANQVRPRSFIVPRLTPNDCLLRVWCPRPRHFGAVVLNVDGLRPIHGLSSFFGQKPEERRPRPESWSPQALGALTALSLPVVVILRDADEERLSKWDEWAKTTRLGSQRGYAIGFADLGRQALTDAALRVATERRRNIGDEWIAYRFRPHLYFDSGERYRRPVDVEEFLHSGAVQLCPRPVELDCDTLTGEKPLDVDDGYLALPGPGPRLDRLVSGLRSVLYYHVDWPASEGWPRPPRAKSRPAGDNRVYVDYWWYFPYNPSPGNAGFCGPGFTTDGWTCHDHESDWEGITVALTRDERGLFVPESVTYAQHRIGLTYDWSAAVQRWKRLSDLRVCGRFARGMCWRDADAIPRYEDPHPIVFVADESHASYAEPCAGGCNQVGGLVTRALPEGRHDGAKPWPLNGDEACNSARGCLERLPHDLNGEPALWNAFRGPWGRKRCVVWVLCDTGSAPPGPAQAHNSRYMRPWQAKANGRPVVWQGAAARYGNYRVKR